MAYTRVWDNTLPLGTALDASDIDGEFRRLKEDIAERWTTLFSNTMADTSLTGIEDMTVKAGKTSFLLRMDQGLAGNTNLIEADITAGGYARMLLGYAGGGVNWSWTVHPAADPAQMPPWEAQLTGNICVDSTNGRLVFYSGGFRYFLTPDGAF